MSSVKRQALEVWRWLERHDFTDSRTFIYSGRTFQDRFGALYGRTAAIFVLDMEPAWAEIVADYNDSDWGQKELHAFDRFVDRLGLRYETDEEGEYRFLFFYPKAQHDKRPRWVIP